MLLGLFSQYTSLNSTIAVLISAMAISFASSQTFAHDKAVTSPIQKTPTQQPANPPAPHIKQYDDWFYRCAAVAAPQDGKAVQAGKAVKQCEVAQIQQVKHGDQTVTVLSVAIALTAPEKKGQKPSLLMTSIAPLNVYLPEGLRYSVEGRDVVKTPYRNCNQAGCWAQQKLTAKMVSSFSKAQQGDGHFRLVDGQNVNIKFSLKGLSQALSALEKREPIL